MLSPAAAITPQTPERGRCRTRYPSHLSRQLDDEGKPRPLLHRRGTSHMYETLEDLLKEAGYKETRIFTPELERRDVGRKRDIGGAVVKMFSTWMSKKSVVPTDDHHDNDHDSTARASCPSSPLAHRTRAPLSTIAAPRHSPSSSTLRPHPPSPRLKSSTALHHQHLATRAPASPNAHATSRAHLALRHAQSAPHMDKRRARTAPRHAHPHVHTPPVAYKAALQAAPPLPATWLETLSAALLSPRLTPPTSPASPTARKPPVAPTDTLLLPQRTPTPVAVTITNVVCRSAPASRSSSVHSRHKHKHPHKNPPPPPPPPVPTLAQTCVFEEQGGAAVWPPHSPHHLPHATAGTTPDGVPPADLDDDEDDELNLTMMLIPSKRQHSIRSLRSVLHHHHGMHGMCRSAPCSAPGLPSASYVAYARDDGARGRGRVMRRRIEESECEDELDVDPDGERGRGGGGRRGGGGGGGGGGGDEDEGHWDSGEFMTAKVRRRRSHLPRQWSWAV